MKNLGWYESDKGDISINGVFMYTGYDGQHEIVLAENDKDAEQFSIKQDFYVDLRATTLFIGGKEYTQEDFNCRAVRFGTHNGKVAVIPYF